VSVTEGRTNYAKRKRSIVIGDKVNGVFVDGKRFHF